MKRTLSTLALCVAFTILTIPSDVFAGRGGGRGGGGGGGGGNRGGGGGGGGMQGGDGNRGGSGGGGMQGGGNRGGGGGMQGGGGLQGGGGFGGGGGGANHSPSFSQPRQPTTGASSGRNNPFADNSGAGNRNSNSNAGAANRNQQPSNAGAAAAGAGASNRNQQPSNAGAAAAGAGAANRNQQPSNAAAAAAGAGAANRNQPQFSNAGAAAAGAGYANRNQPQYPNAGGVAAGAAYANRNQYDQYHPGMAAGAWNGNYGASAVGGYGGVAAWGAGSAAYGYGYSSYSNPYYGAAGGGGDAQPAVGSAYDYSQPINTSDAPPAQAAADQGSTAIAEARQSFQAGDYDTALRLTQQALGQMPNDATLHEFLGLVLFAQGSYEKAAAPLYAVLSVGPGWDWTTLIANYSDADLYTKQMRGLESFVRANPQSAKAQFVLAYEYITQGQGEAAVRPLESVVVLQPNDTLSAQLLAKLRPASAGAAAPAAPTPEAFDAGKLAGAWSAQPPNAKIALAIKEDGSFEWTVNANGKPPATIKGTATVADGVLTLSSDQANAGNMAGNITWQDDAHFGFRAVGAATNDPGLKFAR